MCVEKTTWCTEIYRIVVFNIERFFYCCFSYSRLFFSVSALIVFILFEWITY